MVKVVLALPFFLFELFDLFLLFSHLFMECTERISLTGLAVVHVVLGSHSLHSHPSLALGIRELHLHVDRAAFDGKETNEDVAVLEDLSLLIDSVHEEDIF